MSNYKIITDSACDIEKKDLNIWNVKSVDLSLSFINENKIWLNSEINIKDFYNKMRNGEVAKTSAVNVECFKIVFEEELKNNNDILYIGFSSGLSTTFNSARLAAEELKEKYVNNKIIIVDSLCASAGQGMLVYLAKQKRDLNYSIEDLYEYLENIKYKICHWFTVDDLVYLKRGGRISSTTAFVGGLLGIKPILHVDNDGHLISMGKVRGRKHSIKLLAQKYEEFVIKKDEGTVFICHGDCLEDANYLCEVLKERYKINVNMIVNTGPVIGAHSGPGTLALFFIGKER